MGLGYGYDKLTTAAHYLVEAGSLAERLENAFKVFHPVKEDDLSPENFEKFKSIYERLTSQEPKGNEGKIGATLEILTSEQQQQLSIDILDLAFDVNAEFLNDPEE